MLRRKWVGWSAICALALGAPVTYAAPHWGAPTESDIIDARDVNDVIADAQGQPQLVHARRMAPAEFFERRGSNAAVDISGNLVEFFNAPTPELVYTPAGSNPQRTVLTTGRHQDFATAVAIDASGNAIATWTGQTGSTYAAYRPATTGVWESPTIVTTEGADTRFVALAPGGGALIAWTTVLTPPEPDSKSHAVLRSSYRPGPGQPWGTVLTLRDVPSEPPSFFSSSSIALGALHLDGSGNALTAWLENTTPASPVKINTATLALGALGWQIDPVVAAPFNFFDDVQVDMAPDGSAVMAHLRGGETLRGKVPITVWRRVSGGAWTPAGPIPSQRRGDTFEPLGLLSLHVAAASGGHVAVSVARIPDSGRYPSSTNPLLWVPMATSAPPGGPFEPMVDLDRPVTRYLRETTSLGIGPDGRVLATWVLSSGFTRDAFLLRAAEYSEQSPPPPPLDPVEVRAIAAPTQPVTTRTWAWLRLTLSRPVEGARAAVTEQRHGRAVVVSRWRVSGKVVYVPVRVPDSQRHRYRVQITDDGHTGTSEAATLRGQRSTRPLIAVSDALFDIEGDRSDLWVLTGSRSSDKADRVRPYDPARGRPVGPGAAVPGAQALAASNGTAWVLGARRVTALRQRRTVQIPLKTPGLLPIDIASDSPTTAWVLLLDDAGRRNGALIRVDARLGRVTRRFTLPRFVGTSDFASLSVANGRAFLASSDFGDFELQVDLGTGRLTEEEESSVVGFGQVWTVSSETGFTRTSPVPAKSAFPSFGSDGLWQAKAGPAGLWLTTINFFDVIFGDRPLTPRLWLLRPGAGQPTRPITTVLPRHDLPFTVGLPFGQFAPVRGGVWVWLPSDGVLARVDEREARAR
jgi:hypothetical protein